jgi:transposase
MTSRGALANDRKSGREAIGRSRGGLTTKIHLAADLRCRPVARLTSPGQDGDSPYFTPLMAAIRVQRRGPGRPRQRPGRAMADKAYSSRANRTWLRRHAIKAVIPVKEDQKKHRRDRGRAGGRPPVFDAGWYTKRNTVERCFSKLSSSAPCPPATTSANASIRAPSTSPRSASGYATPSNDPRDTP